MTAEAKPPTTAELEKLRDEHCEGDPGRCAVKWCDRGTWADWPCLPYILAAEVLRLRGQVERVRTTAVRYAVIRTQMSPSTVLTALDAEPGDQS